MYVDSYAIIVQKDFDGGDSLHREGMYAFGKRMLEIAKLTDQFQQAATSSRSPASIGSELDPFEIAPGIYVRHPDPQKWYSNPATTSRDQLIPVIAYCAANEDYDRLWRLFTATARRGLFAQNYLRIGGDPSESKIPDPMHLTVTDFIRAGGWWTAPLYPLLWVLDSIDLVGTLVMALPLHIQDDHWWPRAKNQNDVDDNNTIIRHLLAAQFKPTLISELNRYLYTVTRPINYGNTKLGETNPVMGALAWYHRDTEGGEGNPELAELYRPLIERYFTYESPFLSLVASLEISDSR